MAQQITRKLSFPNFYKRIDEIELLPPTRNEKIKESFVLWAALKFFRHLPLMYAREVVLDTLRAKGYNLSKIKDRQEIYE